MARTLLILNRLDVVQSMVRALQFRSELGADAEFALRTPDWLRRLEQAWPRRRWLRWPSDVVAARTYRGRERQLARRAAGFDVVYSVGVPSMPLHRRLVEARRNASFKLVTDVVDAQWLPWFRQFGWEHFEQMLAESDAAFVTNQYTGEFARRHCSQVHVIPDAPQIEAFDAQRKQIQRPEQEIRIGWIGGRDTVYSLHGIQEALERVAAERPQVHLRIVGSPRERLPRFERVRWSSVESYDQQSMVREALQMHIGIFPLPHVTESLCRGALKTKIYMAAQAAAVCERLGENQELVEDRRNGLLAEGRQQWVESLLWLIDHPDRRSEIAAAGLQTIRARFTARHVGAILQQALRDVAAQRTTPAAGGGP